MKHHVSAPESIDPRDLVTIKSLASECPNVLSESQLRWIKFNAETNGFAPAFVRINNRIFIHRPTFGKILASGISKKGL